MGRKGIVYVSLLLFMGYISYLSTVCGGTFSNIHAINYSPFTTAGIGSDKGCCGKVEGRYDV